MKLIMIAGQPGSGKSTLARKLAEKLKSQNISFRSIDEHEQDTQIFGDYWEQINCQGKDKIAEFLNCWRKFVANITNEEIIMIDHSVFNQVQYLMALNTSKQQIANFFNEVVNILSNIEVHMIFFDGDSNVVINRVNKVRTYGWGERVSDLLQATPYQVKKGKTGLQGMVDFFADSQVIKRELIKSWNQPIVKVDVTAGDWQSYYEKVLEFLNL